jgi:outer membrane lipoprotein-sorting protein
VTSYAPKKKPTTSEYSLYGRGLDQVLLSQKAPKKDFGKKILMKKDKMWFYFPRAKRSIIVNPSGTLFGTVSIGDVLSPPLLDIYQYVGYRTEDKDGKKLLALTFTANSTRAPYGKLIYFYEDTRIIKCEAYTRSGILLKVAHYQEYTSIQSGDEYASIIRIESGVNKEYYSITKTTNLEKVESLPDSYFSIEGLDKIND